MRTMRVSGGPAFGSPAAGRPSRLHRAQGRTGPALALLLVLSVVGSACGARVGPYLGAGASVGRSGGTGSAVDGTTGSAGSTASPGVTASAGGTTGAAGGTTGSSGSSGTGAPPSVPTASAFSFTPQAEAGACTGTTGNTASAPGITTDAIQIGNVSGLSGPLSGSFPQGPEAVQALFDSVNAAGGVCGRQLQLTAEDDGQNASTNASDTADLIAKPVFAFAGSTSDADDGGVPDIEQANVPDFGFAINCDRSEEPQYWSVAGGSCVQSSGGTYEIDDGNFLNAQQAGYLPKKMAFLAYSIAISAQAAQQYEYVYTHDFGGDACYTDFSISPVTASLESDVEQMQADGCQGVLDTLDVTGNAKLLQALQQQNVSLPYVAATFDAYTPQMISTAGESASQGLIVTVPFVPYDEADNAMGAMYEQQLAQYEPGDQPSGFGFLAWLATQMMIYGLLEAGRNPTRASLTSVLDSLQSYDAGGAVGPHAPADHAAPTCTIDVEVQGDSFVRKAPASGLFCDGQLVVAS